MRNATKRSRLRIGHIQSEPAERLPYAVLPPSGHHPVDTWLPIYRGTVHGLPDEIDTLVIASDLQGMDVSGSEPVMLGVAVPEWLSLYLQIEAPDWRPEKTGVLLCGDLYGDLERRGSSGDPSAAWREFRHHFGLVTGVAGNHDLIPSQEAAAWEHGGMTLLHERTIDWGTLRIAGIGGIIGRPDKPNRMPETQYIASLRRLLRHQPDILLLHPSPSIPEYGLQGEKTLCSLLEQNSPALICCGHTHWPTPWVQWNGASIINADGNIIILTRAEE